MLRSKYRCWHMFSQAYECVIDVLTSDWLFENVIFTQCHRLVQYSGTIAVVLYLHSLPGYTTPEYITTYV
jgi:hypothetical protein